MAKLADASLFNSMYFSYVIGIHVICEWVRVPLLGTIEKRGGDRKRFFGVEVDRGDSNSSFYTNNNNNIKNG